MPACTGALFKFVIPVMFVIVCVGAWFVYSFFNPKPKEIKPDLAKSEQKSDSAVSHAKQDERRKLDVSEMWRVVGWYSTDTGAAVVVQDHDKRVRVVYDPPGLKLQGMQISVVLPEGDTATTYSGGAVSSALPGGKL